jgi:transposase InsO family protein
MNQKTEFIGAWRTKKYSITELCEAFGISRPTAYRLIHRYENYGIEGLLEQSTRPKNHPNKTSEKVEKGILELKAKYPRWGAKKIRILLFKSFSEMEVPSVVTVHNILHKNGLVIPQKRRKRVKPVFPIFDPKHCNEVWSVDYKGKFFMGNGVYCHTLTIADSRSRFLFSAKGHYHENLKSVKEEFTKVFRVYGIPNQIHSDNGSPFGSVRSVQRFTRLSYWFIDLGIIPVFSDPSHPEQNGRHERMHRDLKAACARPSCYDLKAQQTSLNRFVKEYNHERPHEALGMKTPGEVHDFSTRAFPEKITEYEYDIDMIVQRVTNNGALRWAIYSWVYISKALSGKRVGLRYMENGIWRVYYRNIYLGYFDEINKRDNIKSLILHQNLV